MDTVSAHRKTAARLVGIRDDVGLTSSPSSRPAGSDTPLSPLDVRGRPSMLKAPEADVPRIGWSLAELLSPRFRWRGSRYAGVFLRRGQVASGTPGWD
jgi:hypothetical protein